MKILPPTDLDCSVPNSPAAGRQSVWIGSGLSLLWLIINFVSSWVTDLTKDLSKIVHLPARAFVCLLPAASSKNQLSPYLTGILSASHWNITLYIGGRMSSQSCNDDAGLCPVHPLISLAKTHYANGFAQTFAQMPAKSGQTNFQFITAYEK
jgi:hypothetical protein